MDVIRLHFTERTTTAVRMISDGNQTSLKQLQICQLTILSHIVTPQALGKQGCIGHFARGASAFWAKSKNESMIQADCAVKSAELSLIHELN